MARFNKPLRPRRRRTLLQPGTDTAPGSPTRTWWVIAAISLLLVAVPILLFNQQHSGDGVKIRRELRKF
jgi:hypothetical protein